MGSLCGNLRQFFLYLQNPELAEYTQTNTLFKYNAIKLWIAYVTVLNVQAVKDCFKANCKTFLMNKMFSAEKCVM